MFLESIECFFFCAKILFIYLFVRTTKSYVTAQQLFLNRGKKKIFLLDRIKCENDIKIL